MKKKFSILTAKHNGKDIFDGSHTDRNGNTGIKGVTYLTGRAAEKVCKEQNKKLLNDRLEVEQFVSFFPGESIKEKIFNFIKLFGLEKAGYRNSNNKEWFYVGSLGYVSMSNVNDDDYVYELGWKDVTANMTRRHQVFSSFFLSYEDC